MNIEYFPYKKNFLKKLKSDEKTIIVFNDYFLKNSYIKNRTKNLLEPEGILLTMEEFDKFIFKTKKLILTEAKRFITLYKTLDEKYKKNLKINNYFDIIDFGNEFFKYYREKNRNLINNFKNIQKWQSSYIETFDNIKKNYDDFLRRKNFIPIDWIESYENFNIGALKNYKKIIFVDVFDFSKLHKKILMELEEKLEIEIYLQCNEEDYNEEELKLNKVSLKGVDKNNIKIYEISEDIEVILNLIYLHKNKDSIFDIFVPSIEKNRFHKVFPKYFKNKKLKVLDESDLYEFMNKQCNLLNSFEEKKSKGLKIESLNECLENEIFCRIYKINKKIANYYRILMEKEYRYLNKNILNSEEIMWLFKNEPQEEVGIFINGFNNIYDDLIEISSYTKIEEIYKYFKKLGLERFQEYKYLDLMEKFYEVLENVKSSERLLGSNGFKTLFTENIGASIYRLLIKYLEGIEIREVEKEKSENMIGIIKELSDARLNFGKESYYLDITNELLPGLTNNTFIFSEKQMEENNFQTKEEKMNIIKQRFIQGIFNSKKVFIFTKKNGEKGIERSIFLEELILENKLSIEEKLFSQDDIKNILEKSLYKKRNFFIKRDTFNLEKNIKNIKDNKIILGAYDILMLSSCEYKYFLNKMINIEKEEETSYGASLKLIGITVHKVFEQIGKKMRIQIEKDSDFSLDESLVDKYIQRAKDNNKMKVPAYLDIYLEKIIYPFIKSSIVKFYEILEKKYSKLKINKFYSEKEKYYLSDYCEGLKNYPEILINGRIDLVIESSLGNTLVDYKTGGKQNEQLDIYSIIMYEGEKKVEKMVYNVFKLEEELQEKNGLSKEKLNKIFLKFVEGKYYTRTEKKSMCSGCNYSRICRREESHEEDIES